MAYVVIAKKGEQEVMRFKYKTYEQAAHFIKDAYEGIANEIYEGAADQYEHEHFYFEMIIEQ